MTTALTVKVSVLALVTALGAAACGSPAAPASSKATVVQPAAVPRAASDPLTIQKCSDGKLATASYEPQHDENWYLDNSSVIAKIKAKGRLVVGTSGDVKLWGARNPFKGNLEGYDISLLQKIAAELDVDLTYRVITYADRIPDLQSRQVDIVAHTMTINCVRWAQIAFSSEYYEAGQKVLVRKEPESGTPLYANISALKGKSICVAKGSTNLDNVKPYVDDLGLKEITVDDLGECLVKFQQGEAEAVTGDDTVLAGFAAQDPYATVVGGAFSKEPYGLGFNREDKEFAEFVNVLLEKWRGDGTLAGLYQTYMAGAVKGAAPPIPQPVYGRTGNTTDKAS